MSIYDRVRSNTPRHLDRVVRVVRDAAWMDDAACSRADRDLWYEPEHEIPPAREARISEARAVCGSCAVRSDCLQTALVNHEPHGVWGGLTTSERYALARAIEEIA